MNKTDDPPAPEPERAPVFATVEEAEAFLDSMTAEWGVTKQSRLNGDWYGWAHVNLKNVGGEGDTRFPTQLEALNALIAIAEGPQ
jgi:hypothetical protein